MRFADLIVPILTIAFGGGGIWSGISAWRSHREGVRAADVQEDAQRLQERSDAIAGYDKLTERHEKEIARLSAALVNDRARMDAQDVRIREQDRRIEEITSESRLYRSVLLGVVDRLRRVPPLDPAAIVEYIRSHIPTIGGDHHDHP